MAFREWFPFQLSSGVMSQWFLQFKWRRLESNPGHFDNLANAVTAGSLGHFKSLNIFQCKVEA